MADESGFKHISVTPDDDDDFVIVAGAGAATQVLDDEEPLTTEAPLDSSEGHVQPFEADTPKPEPAPARDPEPSPAPEPVSKQPKGGVKNDYQETTLEDLQTSSMSTTQKIVLGVAAVIVVIIVLYVIFIH